MRIHSIKTKSGETIQLNKISVLVGANNAGKSRVLKDIRDYMINGLQAKPVVLDTIEFIDETYEELLEGLDISESPHSIGNSVVKGINSSLQTTESFEFNEQHLRQQLQQTSYKAVVGTLTKLRVAHLDSSTRLNLALSCQSLAPKDAPQNLLQHLYFNKEIEAMLQQAFKESFNSDIKLDYSELQTFCLRVAEKLPEIPKDPQEAYPITKDLPKIDDQGDGYRSFVGIILGLLLSKDRIILLDEPEAFLHPAQARYLGKWIVDNSENFRGQILIATHNASFLSGLLTNSSGVDIFRLNRSGNTTSFNLISASTNEKLAKTPLLSSQRVLEAIFHKGVVICEADADRALYQGVSLINLKNLEILFIHSHNKQTLKDVAGVLKEANIPTCVVADIDILNSKDDLAKLLGSLTDEDVDDMLKMQQEVIVLVNSETEEQIVTKTTNSVEEFLQQLKNGEHNLSGMKGALNRIEKDCGKWSVIKDKGINGFPEAAQEFVTNIVERSKGFGLFIVPVGELEGWIELGVKRKNKWIIPALERVYNNKSPDILISFVQELVDYLNKK